MRCQAKTRSGRPCNRQALVGGERCHAHSGEQVGRPEKLTDEVKRRLLEAIRAGTPVEVAAEYAGIARSTFYRWLALADTEERYRGFREEVRKAEAEAHVHAAAVIRKAIADGDWRAALKYLERRHPQDWGPRRAEEAPPRRRWPWERSDDLDLADKKTRRLLSEVLRRRPSSR